MTIARILLTAAFLLAGANAAAQPAIVGSLPLNGQPALLRVDAVLHRAFYVDRASGNLVAVDLDALKVVGETGLQGTVNEVRVDTAHHRVYVLHDTSPGAVTVVDGKSNAVVARITVGNGPIDIAANFQRAQVYTADYEGKQVTIIDTKANAVAGVVALSDKPNFIAVSAVSGKVYVSLPDRKSIVVIDPAARAVVKTIPMPMNPLYPFIDDRAGKLSVAGYDPGFTNHVDQLAVIDLATDAVSASGGGIDLSRDTSKGTWQLPTRSAIYGRAYFPNYLAGTIDVVGAGNTYVSKKIAAAGKPMLTVVNEDDGEIYVADAASDTVAVIDARLERVAASIKLGKGFAYSLARFADRLAIFGYDSGAATLYVATAAHIQPSTTIATDYHHAGFDHYFHTANGDEANVLNDGAFGEDWKQTQQYWRVWKTAGVGRVPVCRFFSTTFGVKSSHFYTPYDTECAALKAGNALSYEEIAYYVALPDASGKCSPAFRELYRLYNNGMGDAPNHAYTPSRAVRDALAAKGWIPEGIGPDNVFACTPPLDGFVTSAP
jgi:YVTN family beta-propeller protein